MKRFAATSLAMAALLLSSRASAYRPFDGTDADVAKEGEFELELGPVHYYRLGSTDYLIAPGGVLNLGIVRNLELVVDFEEFVGLEHVDDENRVRLLDDDVQAKWLVRRGTLQGESGLSIAIEAGPLFPEIGGEKSFGAAANAIFSYRVPVGTVHFNEELELSREQHVVGFSSVILEGPSQWAARPVSEIFIDHDFAGGTAGSLLLGAICPVTDGFVLDAGVRGAREEETNALEVRAGFTWAVALWEKS